MWGTSLIWLNIYFKKFILNLNKSSLTPSFVAKLATGPVAKVAHAIQHVFFKDIIQVHKLKSGVLISYQWANNAGCTIKTVSNTVCVIMEYYILHLHLTGFNQTHLNKFLNGLEYFHIEGFGLNPTEFHVTQEAIDDL